MSNSAYTPTETPPDISLQPDWIEVQLPFQIGSGRTLYSGLEGINRLRLRVYKKVTDGSLVGRAWFGMGADGPPGHVHGGAAAYVLDEAMGSVAWMNNHPVVAAKLEFQYHRMTPLKVDLWIEAKILSVTARRLTVEALLRLPDGEVCVSGVGEFAILDPEKIAKLNSFKAFES